MTFFLVFALAVHGELRPVDRWAARDFPTRAACYAEGLAKARAVASTGAHGRFLCMRPGEPDAAIARERVVTF